MILFDICPLETTAPAVALAKAGLLFLPNLILFFDERKNIYLKIPHSSGVSPK